MSKIKVICPVCGSDDVRRDASAAWSVDNQTWELVTEYDEMTCQNCGYEGHTFDEEILDAE